MRKYICIRSKDDNTEALKKARMYSPNMEILDERTLVFDLTGKQAGEVRGIAERIFDEGHFQAVAVSENFDTCILLANNREGVVSEKSGHLQQLPISVLNKKRDFSRLMQQWGIENLGEFCQLPEAELVSRFGSDISGSVRIASGKGDRVPVWNVRGAENAWSTELDGEIETIEPLNFILSAGIKHIFDYLDEYGLSTQSSRLVLSGRSRQKKYNAKLVFPNKKEKIWLRQIINKIELDPPGFAVDRISLEFKPCKPRTIQNDLYSGAVMEPENLDLIISKLKKVVGLTKIGVPVLKNSWAREFGFTEEISQLLKGTFSAGKGDSDVHANFFFLPSSTKCKVQFISGKPRSIILMGSRSAVIKAGGPWRKDAEWFQEERLSADEWDLETESGAIYRISVRGDGESFVEGGYD